MNNVNGIDRINEEYGRYVARVEDRDFTGVLYSGGDLSDYIFHLTLLPVDVEGEDTAYDEGRN